MLAPPPDHRVLELWRRLANAPDALAGPGVTIVSDDEARVAPPGWCGVVAIANAAIVTTPTARPAQIEPLLRSSLSPVDLTDPELVTDLIGSPTATRGPAALLYGRVQPLGGSDVAGPFRTGDPLVQRALEPIPAEDAFEAGLQDDSVEAIFVAIDRDEPVALAGYRRWEGLAAHIGVATAPASRRGHGRRVAAAAAGHATEQGLLVQWRSRSGNDASLGLGRDLGLVECGRQLSFQPAGA
jgi:hypothetical protein